MRYLPCLLLMLMPLTAQAQDKPAPSAPPAAQSASSDPQASQPTPKKAAAKTFNAEHFTLSNGMDVVVIPNHRAPIVTHMIWYKVGAADEKPGLSGMAHYFEHLMFKGTKDMAPGAYSKRIKMLGGNDNAFTSQDLTAYYANISVNNLFDVMQMEADRMQNLNPPPEHFASEKAVVIEERRERTDNDPRSRFGEQLQSMIFVNHPYSKPVIGWMNEIERYEWPDVKTFYDTWYAPNNAILIISGDMTAERLKPAAEEIYGKIPAKKLPPRARPSIPPADGIATLTKQDDDIHQPVWQSVYLAPSFKQNKKDALALQVLQEVISSGPTTRLYDSLVVQQKKAVSVDMGYNATALDYGSITLSGIPADGVSLPELQKLTEKEIKHIIDHGVEQTDVDEAIARIQDDAIYARDSVSGPAMIVGYGLTTGASLEDIENWPNDIAEVTAADVQRVAATYLNRAKPWIRPAVTGYLMPKDKEAQE